MNIMDVKGAGIITHIWITLAPGADTLNRNDVIIRMYWDGKPYPSVEAPIGAFFGNGWGEAYNFVSAPLAVTPGWGKSYVSYFAMPFAEGARIEIENQSGRTIDALYFNIDYEEVPQLPPDLGRFHAWYNHQLTEALPGGENEWGLLGPSGQEPRRQAQLRLRRHQGPGPPRRRQLLRELPEHHVVRRGRRDDLHRRRHAAHVERHRHRGLLQHLVVAQGAVPASVLRLRPGEQ